MGLAGFKSRSNAFCWPSCSLLFCLQLFSLSLLLLYRLLVWGWGLWTIGCQSPAPGIAVPIFFNNDNKATYIVGTLHYYISELFPLLLHTSPHFIFFMQALLYALYLTLLFSSLTFDTFLTPSMLPALLQPPTNFSPTSTQKKWSNNPPPYLLSVLSHLTVFQAFVLVTTHDPLVPCLPPFLPPFSTTCINTHLFS